MIPWRRDSGYAPGAEMVRALTHFGAGILPVFAALLPRRYWPGLGALPIARVSLLSSILTFIASAIVGLGGFLDYSERVGREVSSMTVRVAERQLQGKLPPDERYNAAPLAAAMLAPVAFVFTPMGLLATYLALSGAARALSHVVDEPWGDPALTIVDSILRRTATRARETHRVRLRERREGVEAPDRLYPATWAAVNEADFVVASRRKQDWDAGTFLMTSDRCFVVGVPFERELPDGLRTIYPITEHKTLDVIRRSVAYELPPLRACVGGAKAPP